MIQQFDPLIIETGECALTFHAIDEKVMPNRKMMVLKPVVWNDQGYRWPAGRIATSGYTKDNGYGHEEWNGRDDWVWNGWKVFHTQAKGEMPRYAKDGRLGIIMTAMNAGNFFAAGAGCNVFENNEEDAVAIAEALPGCRKAICCAPENRHNSEYEHILRGFKGRLRRSRADLFANERTSCAEITLRSFPTSSGRLVARL